MRAEHPNGAGFCSVEEAVAEVRRGRMLILAGDEEVEAVGDLCLAADAVTPEAITFMATHARGLVCLALDASRFDRLGLPLMVPEHANQSARGIAFGVSIEARSGVTTGISAFDRAHTIRTAIADAAVPTDLSRPGHIFPVRARPLGVLEHPGLTEGSVDLARLAGRSPGAVTCEIMNEDGSLAGRSDLRRFAERHGLKIVSIADLVHHRLISEPLVQRMAESKLPTAWGEFRAVVFRSELDGRDHVALIKGRIRPEEPALVTLHRECLIGDVFGSARCECGTQLDSALAMLGAADSGVLLYLRNESRRSGFATPIATHAPGAEPGCQSLDTTECSAPRVREEDDWISVGILRSLGICRLRLLANDPEKSTRIQRYGIEVSERIPLGTTAAESNLGRGREDLLRGSAFGRRSRASVDLVAQRLQLEQL